MPIPAENDFLFRKALHIPSADRMIIPRTDDIIVIRVEKNIGFHLCITVYQHRAVLLVLIQNRVFYTLDFSVIPSHQQCVNAISELSGILFTCIGSS